MYKIFLKRLLDMLTAGLLLILLLPILIITAVLIKLTSSGPVFFIQNRVGKNTSEFKLYKFRTMYHRPRKVSKVLKDDPDVTAIGYFLRRFKIDELPQLINVLIGQMSLVGPRPCVPDTVKEFNEDGIFRIKVKPGLTGMAQVNGNIHLSWPERWKYDRLYVENLSFILDIKIIIKTIGLVLFGEERFIKKKQ